MDSRELSGKKVSMGSSSLNNEVVGVRKLISIQMFGFIANMIKSTSGRFASSMSLRLRAGY